MPTLTNVRHEINRAVESAQVPKPLYAVAGVGDLAIEKLRSAERRVRELHLEQRIAGIGDEARALPSRVQHVQAGVQGRVRELPGSVVDAAITASDRAAEVYDGLSTRGKKLVAGLAAQRAVTVTDAAPANTTSEADEAAQPAAGTSEASASKPSGSKAGAKSSAKTSTAKKATKKA